MKKIFIFILTFILLISLNSFIFAEDTTENITFSGKGDDVIEISNPGDKNFFLMKVIGNKQKRHLAITGYNQNNEMTDVYVNTTNYYEGLTPVNKETKMLEIKATGEWEVILKPIKKITVIEPPGDIEGNGDYIFKLNGNVMKADIIGNNDQKHFAIMIHDANFNLIDVAVNTTDKYEGTVMIPNESVFVEVIASGNWNISF